MKQTIKVRVSDFVDGRMTFEIDGNVIARITGDFFNAGKYCGSFHTYGYCSGCTLPEAVEKVLTYIENHFRLFYLGVEFEK